MVTAVIIFILLVVGFLFPSNAKVSLLGWGYLLWLSISAPQQALLGDYTVYQYSYGDLLTHGSQFEKGYTFLTYLGNMAGLEFETFRKCFVAFGVFVLYLGVRRFTKNHAFVLAYYIPTIWVIDIIQMRSFVMMDIMVFGFSLLINPTRSNKVLAFLIILLGASIHSSGYLFLIGFILVLFIKSITNTVNKLVISEVVGVSILPILLKSSLFITLVSFLGEITGRSSLVNNLTGLFISGTTLHLKLLYYFILACATIILSIVVKEDVINNDSKMTKKIEPLIGGLSILFVGTAFLVIAPDYSRLIRHGLVFLFILIALYLQIMNEKNQSKANLFFVGILSIILEISVNYAGQITWGVDIPNSLPYLLHLIY